MPASASPIAGKKVPLLGKQRLQQSITAPLRRRGAVAVDDDPVFGGDLFGLGALASWADSEAVLPAYIVGMVLAGTVGKDHALIRRLRTLTFGFLTPFYFIRAGSFVSVPALIAAPGAFLPMLGTRLTEFIGIYPVTRGHRSPRREALYTTLLMSTGLTFGTISSLFGLSHGIIDQDQYSILVAAVIASAVVPTLIANAFYLSHHLLPETAEGEVEAEPVAARVPRKGHG